MVPAAQGVPAQLVEFHAVEYVPAAQRWHAPSTGFVAPEVTVVKVPGGQPPPAHTAAPRPAQVPSGQGRHERCATEVAATTGE